MKSQEQNGARVASSEHPHLRTGFWRELKDRRVVQIVGSYAAAGWITLEAVGSLVERRVLPEVVYQIGLNWFVGGLVAAMLVGWLHGERGHQRAPRYEIVLLGLLFVACLSLSAADLREHRATRMAIQAAETGGLDVRSIAVLYFHDAGLNEHPYLADVLTEELIDRLSEVRALDVISRNGVAPFRDTDIAVDSVARLLNVGTVVTGTVEERGDEIRVVLRLIDGESGTESWRTRLEHPVGSLPELGAEVAERASEELRRWLREEVRVRQSRLATRSVPAWAQMQRAEKRRREAQALAAEGDTAASASAFAQADALAAKAELLDRSWVDPLVLRARVAYNLATAERSPHSRWTEIGLGHAERAVAMNPNHAPAREVRGTLRYWRYHMPSGLDNDARRRLLDSARVDLEEAVRLDPTLASAYVTLSNLYYEIPDIASALLAGRRAYEEDAYLENAAQVIYRLFSGYLDAEQFGDASYWCREGGRRFPGDSRFANCRVMLMATPAQPPDVASAWRLVAAVDSLATVPRRDFERVRATIWAAGVIARAGLPDSARAVLRRVEAEIPTADPTQGLFAAAAYPYLLLGDHDQAISSYKRYLLANPQHAFKPDKQIGWWWRSLRQHPRFPELMARR